MSDPCVSVVIPAHQAERHVGEAIESALAQTMDDIEICVVDDGSTDATAAVAASYRGVRVLRQANQGVSAARNAGIAATSGRYVALLDADDRFLPRKLELQVRRAEALPSAGCVTCGIHLVDDDGRFLGRMRPVAGDRALRNTLLLERPTLSVVPALLRRSALEDVGGFDVRLSTSADFDLALRLAAAHPVEAVAEPLYVWRQHGGGMHLDARATEHDALIAFAKAFASPRLPGDLRRLRRRAHANLYVTLTAAHLRNRDVVGAVRTSVSALRWDPTRVFAAVGRLAAPGGPEGWPDDPVT